MHPPDAVRDLADVWSQSSVPLTWGSRKRARPSLAPMIVPMATSEPIRTVARRNICLPPYRLLIAGDTAENGADADCSKRHNIIPLLDEYEMLNPFAFRLSRFGGAVCASGN